MTGDAILEIRGLSVSIRTRRRAIAAVRDVSLRVFPGTTVAIVGESGSGKSVTASAVLGLLDPQVARVQADVMRFRDEDLLDMTPHRRRQIRGSGLAVVPQDGIAALNPLLPVGRQIAEMFRYHLGTPRAAALERATELMARVGIPDAGARLRDLPHQFSGGMRQRVVIAIAIALEPALLIADEATSALDVTTQVQVIEVLRELRTATDMSLLFITHDLLSVANIAERVVVMYAGEVVEEGAASAVLDSPRHPYTVALLAATPRLAGPRSALVPLPLASGPAADPQTSCAFAPRCRFRQDVCWTQRPVLRESAAGGSSACHFPPDEWEPRP